MFKNNVDSFFSKLEWRWSLANLLWGLGALASATLPAGAVWTMALFSSYAPLSWVAAGLVGFFVFSCSFLIYAVARERLVRARYNARSLSGGGYVNPLERVFERKRIYLNDFALPSNPFIQGKTFVDCEIIGPANVYLAYGNRVDQAKLPKCDAAVLPPNAQIFNSCTFIECSFTRCSFQRITFFVSDQEYPSVKLLDWLNWVTYGPHGTLPLLAGVPDGKPLLPKASESEIPK